MFHFFHEWESDKYFFIVERKLGSCWKKFQGHLKEKVIFMDDEETKTFIRVNVNKFDFSTRFMGFEDPIVIQDLPNKSYFETFF